MSGLPPHTGTDGLCEECGAPDCDGVNHSFAPWAYDSNGNPVDTNDPNIYDHTEPAPMETCDRVEQVWETLKAPKSDTESFAHAHAKELFCGWLREAAATVGLDGCAKLFTASPWGGISWRVNRAGPVWGVHLEFPHCGQNWAWDEQTEWFEYLGQWGDKEPTPEEVHELMVTASQRVPTFEECIAMKLPPITISDIAIQQKGRITAVIEIWHKHKIEPDKLAYLWTHDIEVYQVPARWVLGQLRRPERMPDFRLQPTPVQL